MLLVASAPRLIYLYNGLIKDFMIISNIVSTGLGINLHQASPKRYVVGAKELQVICVPNNMCICGIRKYVVFPQYRKLLAFSC